MKFNFLKNFLKSPFELHEKIIELFRKDIRFREKNIMWVHILHEVFETENESNILLGQRTLKELTGFELLEEEKINGLEYYTYTGKGYLNFKLRILPYKIRFLALIVSLILGLIGLFIY